MKKNAIILLMLAWLVTSARIANAQADTIYVSDAETVYLIFAEEVALVDIGRTGEYLARIEGQSVFLKAKDNLAQQTNILVRHGQDYFTATLDFAVDPAQNLYDFRKDYDGNELEQGDNKKSDFNLSEVEAQLNILKEEKGKARGLRHSRHNLKLKVTHIRNGREATYLGISIANNSSIAYEVDFVGFSLSEKQGRKFSKNNSYRKDITPYVSSGAQVIPRQEGASLYFALPLYAMTSRGKLDIAVREKHGSRILRVSIPARKINKAPTF